MFDFGISNEKFDNGIDEVYSSDNKVRFTNNGDVRACAKGSDETSTLSPKQSGVTVKRYMMEITTYPNGQEYTKCWCVHTGTKKPKKKVKSKKKLTKTEIKSVEEY